MAKTQNNNTFLLLALAGAAAFVFRKQLFGNLIEDFENGILYSFSRVRIRFTGAVITAGSIKIPTGIALVTEWKVRNTNAIGIRINGFSGSIRYGQNGAFIAPVEAAGFDLSPNVERTVSTETNLNVLLASNQIKNVIQAIGDGNLRNLYIEGVLKTSLKDIQVSREIPLIVQQ